MNSDGVSPAMTGCSECESVQLSRRGFLGGAAGLAALGMVSGFGPFGST